MFSYTTANWQALVENGDYEITLTVGDSGFTQGPQRVAVENKVFVDDQVVPVGNPLRAVGIISVRDGVLDVQIGNGTGSTTLDFLTAAKLPSAGFLKSVNFQPSGSIPAGGFQTDSGEVFDAGRGYGWNYSLPSRDRNIQMPQFDTFVFSSLPTTWEMAVENGTYEVTVSAGDSQFSQGPHRVVVEGVLLIEGTTSLASPHRVKTATVVVTDGRLTVTIGGGGGNTTMNFITIAKTD